MFDGPQVPTALFCGNDLMAIGAEQAAIARGLRIPQDIAIAGYDDIRFAATSLVPLTSVRNPAYELGLQAAELLIDEVANGPNHKHRSVLLEPELVVRESTHASGQSNGAMPGRSRVAARG
jgi:LacI family transcriptional regulator